MKQPNRRDLAAEEARNRILVAAADCIVRDGLAQVRMAGIAQAAGVSSGLVHYHFATKEQLFVEVLSHSSTVSHALTEQALERAGTQPAQRLSAFLDRCLPSDERLTHDWLLWQELDLLCLRQPELARVGAELYETIYASVAEIIADGIEAGVFDLDRRRGPRPWPRPRSRCATGSAPGSLAAGPTSPSTTPGTMVALAVGRLVGHAGPLPRLDRALQEAGA